MSFVGNAVKGLFGGGQGTQPSQVGYASPFTSGLDTTTNTRLNQRIGSTSNPLQLNDVTAPYAQPLGNMTQAQNQVAGASYNPTQYSFTGLPQQYYNQAYGLQSQNVDKNDKANLQNLQEAVGTRRPGLLAKIGQNQQRQSQQNQATLAGQLGQEQMQQGVQTNELEQQLNNQLAAQKAQFPITQGQALSGLASGNIGAEQGILGGERGYQDQGLQMLMNAFGQRAPLQGQANLNASNYNYLNSQNNAGALQGLLGALGEVIPTGAGGLGGLLGSLAGL